jgi:tetratricopeptide (TPR) repeat protein
MIEQSRTWIVWLAVASLAMVGRTARAEDCPSAPPADRRTSAKQWFGRAEAAERGKDELGALHAYQCSMRMVPHAFTAYNLARVAEQIGDLELALEAYRQYLGLKPNAEDSAEVSAHIPLLEQRVAALRAERPTLPAAPPPAVSARDPVSAAPPPAGDRPPLRLHRTDWIVGGAAAASLVVGTAFNLVARSKMSDCRALADADHAGEALAACQGARPFAYASYALLGAAGVAVLVDLAVVINRGRAERLSLVPVTGGVSLALRGRF